LFSSYRPLDICGSGNLVSKDIIDGILHFDIASAIRNGVADKLVHHAALALFLHRLGHIVA